jgi:hypothetical protein
MTCGRVGWLMDLSIDMAAQLTSCCKTLLSNVLVLVSRIATESF